MRNRAKNQKISVHAIAGTEVVLLGLDATDEAKQGLLGFAINRLDRESGKTQPLWGGKTFEEEENPKEKSQSRTFPIHRASRRPFP